MISKRFLARVLTVGVVGLGAFTAAPAAQADPVIPINWNVDVTTTIKKLNKTVTVPTGTFAGQVDLGTGDLTGDLSLPPATSRLDLGSLPLANVTIQQVQAAPTTGKVDLLAMTTTTTSTYHVKLVSIRPIITPWLNLVGNSCRTKNPVVSTLSGQLDLINGSTVNGTFTLGKFANCGLFTTPVINLVMPGDGNTVSAKFSPPAA